MPEEKDPLLEEALKILRDPEWQAQHSCGRPYLRGDDVEEICRKGMEQFERNHAALHAALTTNSG